MARWEPPRHEKTTALDHSMELQADRTEIVSTEPEVAEPLCAAPLWGDVRCAPPQEIAETVRRALKHLTDRLLWEFSPSVTERLKILHHDIEVAHMFIRPARGRNASHRILSELRECLTRLLGDSLLEYAFDYDDDDYQDTYEDTWDDGTTWGKGSTTTPTTETSDVHS